MAAAGGVVRKEEQAASVRMNTGFDQWEPAYRRIRGYSSAQIMNMSMAISTIAQTG